MKKSYIASALLGGAFFAVPYLALSAPIWASALSAVAAYGAGMLIFKEKEQGITLSYGTDNLYEVLKQAKENTAKIREISRQIESVNMVNNIKEICSISDKIIDTISKKPEKVKQASNFLNYYLPVTIKMLTRYDEIENQRLTTKDSEKFMKSIQDMVQKIKVAFQNQLEHLYQPEMIDTDAEIKVFESMLKMDGFIDDGNFNKK